MTPDSNVKALAREACGCAWCREGIETQGNAFNGCSRTRIERALLKHERAVREEDAVAVEETAKDPDARYQYVLVGAFGVPCALKDAAARIRAMKLEE